MPYNIPTALLLTLSPLYCKPGHFPVLTRNANIKSKDSTNKTKLFYQQNPLNWDHKRLLTDSALCTVAEAPPGICVWVCVYVCGTVAHAHLFSHQPQPQHEACAPNKASLCMDMDTVWFLAQFPQCCLGWNLNTLLAMGEIDCLRSAGRRKKGLSRESSGSNAGPAGVDYRHILQENSGWPLIPIPGEMGASHGDGGLRVWGPCGEGWIDACGQAATRMIGAVFQWGSFFEILSKNI